MAICVPRNDNYENKAEEKVYKFIKENLEDKYILYHNYEVNGSEFDFLLVDPDTCMYVIEVKGWNAVDIIKVLDKKTIKYTDKNNDLKVMEESPLDQVRNYKFKLIKKIKGEFNFNAKVTHLVCYPNITEKDFDKLNLKIVSEKEITLLSDDLNDKEKFLSKIFSASNNYKTDNIKLTNIEVNQIRSLFESEEDINNLNNNIEKENNSIGNDELLKVDNIYSLIVYNDNNDKLWVENLYKKLIDLWKNGTKIYFFSNDYEIIRGLLSELKNNLFYLSRYDEFKIKEDTTAIFNFSTYLYVKDDSIEDFFIIDGDYTKYNKEIIKLDSLTSFNLNQYQLEHEKTDSNIIVKAGAGTGKTYSMISRITYLIYKHKYLAEDIESKICLITFTNEAADNMKSRLRKYFMSYYLLTGNKSVFQCIESISKMNISTIHSLCKRIIDNFSSSIGLGNESKIINAIRERDKIIEEIIDEYIKNKFPNKDILEVFNFRTFELTKRISGLLEKIEQKNILLSDENDFGECDSQYNRSFNDMISVILPQIQEKLLVQANENNSVRLSQLIIVIREILNKSSSIVSQNIKLDYLFVDEFQDTDDVQIDLMKEFQKIIGFNFFVVGDIKQCIYRFRGAKDDAFERLDSEQSFKVCKLVKNYRTDKKLLEDFHLTFKSLGENGYLIYADEDRLKGIKNINKINDKQFINIEYNEVSFSEKFIKNLKAEIEVLRNKGIKNNKLYSIAVLVRTNREVDEIKSICNENGIQIDVDSGGNLYKIKPARDLYLLLLAMYYNKDPKCLFNIFETSYTIKREDMSVMFKYRGDKAKLIEYYNKISPIENWEKYIERLKTEPVMKVIRELIFTVKPWEIYAYEKEDAEREKEELYYKRNLEQVLEEIIKSYDNDYITINKIIEFLYVNTYIKANVEPRESSLDENTNGVNVVCKTVHKSKGLEYDTVIIPYCNKNINEKRIKGPVDVIIEGSKIGYSILNDNPFDREQEIYSRIQNDYFSDEIENESKYKFNEEVRVLYVAITRSISKCIYFSSTKSKKGNEKRWQDLIKEIV